MFEFNKKTNLLESTTQAYPLIDVKEPNLYREYFTYDEVPKVVFNHRLVPMEVPEKIWITDTTFRDGQQSRQPYTVEQMTHLFDLIHRLSGPKGIVKMSEFFLYTKKDRDAVYKCLEKAMSSLKLQAGLELLKRTLSLLKK